MEWIGQEFKYTAKQGDCFNHRVVTLVADKLEKQYWVMAGCWLKTTCIRQQERLLPNSSYNHNTLTTLRTSVKGSLQMHFKAAVRRFHVSR